MQWSEVSRSVLSNAGLVEYPPINVSIAFWFLIPQQYVHFSLSLYPLHTAPFHQLKNNVEVYHCIDIIYITNSRWYRPHSVSPISLVSSHKYDSLFACLFLPIWYCVVPGQHGLSRRTWRRTRFWRSWSRRAQYSFARDCWEPARAFEDFEDSPTGCPKKMY